MKIETVQGLAVLSEAFHLRSTGQITLQFVKLKPFVKQ